MSATAISSPMKKRLPESELTMAQEQKRLRGIEHDLTIVVGTQKFYHYSWGLRLASEYFDVMLGTRMREGETMEVNFPHRDPAEWKTVFLFLDPATARSAKITRRNAEALVSWFHEFQMSRLLDECDEVICRHFPKYDGARAERREIKKARAEVKDLLNRIDFCMKYSLKKSCDKGIGLLKHLVENETSLFDQKLCSRVIAILDNSSARRSLWPSIRRKLMTDRLRSASAEELLDNPLPRDLLMLFLASDGEMRSRRG